MARYDTDIDMANPNSSQVQIAEMVGPHKTVLDVGCATGYLARQLGAQDCLVYGLDNDASSAEHARDALVELTIADLDNSSLTDHFETEMFDAVIFGDVLEHLVHPEEVLAQAVTLLKSDGRIVVSIPNVAHGSIRLALLQGRWQYTDTGLIDRTHLRFFTRESVYELLHGAGLEIEDVRSTVFDPLTADVQVDAEHIPPAIIEWVRDQPESFNYQFIAAARLQEGDRSASPPELVPAFPDSTVRLEDTYAANVRQQLQDERDMRHRLLTVRDHIIGLEVGLASATDRVAKAEARAVRADQGFSRARKRANRANKRLERADEKLARAQKQARQAAAKATQAVRRAEQADIAVQDLKRSRTWRVGRVLARPLGVGRDTQGA